MTVTIKDIMNQFNLPRARVRQVKSQQLFIVEHPMRGRLLVSYHTVIGYFKGNVWFITKEKFSSSTSRQTNRFIKSLEISKVERY